MASAPKGDRRRRFREGAPAPAKAKATPKTRKTTKPRKGTTSTKRK